MGSRAPTWRLRLSFMQCIISCVVSHTCVTAQFLGVSGTDFYTSSERSGPAVMWTRRSPSRCSLCPDGTTKPRVFTLSKTLKIGVGRIVLGKGA